MPRKILIQIIQILDHNDKTLKIINARVDWFKRRKKCSIFGAIAIILVGIAAGITCWQLWTEKTIDQGNATKG